MAVGLRSILMLLTVGFLWGMNWPAVKYMMTELPPFTIRAIAFPLAAIVLAVIAVLQKQSLWPPAGERVPLFITAFFLIFAFNMLTSLGQSLTQASQAAIIAYTMPAITAVLSVVILKEKMGVRLIVALLLCLAGLTILLWKDLTVLVDSPAGSITMLGAAVCWSFGNIALKLRQWDLAPAARATWFFIISAVLSWPVIWLLESPLSLTMPGFGVQLTMLYHVLCPMVLCYLLWAMLLTRIPVSVAAIAILTAPVVGVLSAVVFLGEPLTWQKTVSLGLIVASILVTFVRPTGLNTTQN